MLRNVTAWLLTESNRGKVGVLIFIMALTVRLIGFAIAPETNISTNARTAILNGADLIRSGDFIANPDYPLLIPPLTALFTALVQSVFGDSLFFVKLTQIVLDAACVWVLFRIGTMVLPHTAAVLGGMAIALYPFTAFTPLYIGSEMLFSLLLALFVYFSIKAFRGTNGWLYLVAGLLLGLSTLARGTTQYFPLFFIAYLFVAHRVSWTSFAKRSAVFAIGFLLMVGPWALRNVMVVDSFIMSSTPGLPILNGASEEFWEIRDRNKNYPLYFAYLRDQKGIAAPQNPSWIEKHEFYKRAAMEKYRERWQERPWSYVPFLAHKFARLWYATETGGNHLLIFLLNAPIYLFALLGGWFMWKERRAEVIFIAILLTYFIAVHVAVYSLFRFLVPAVPYLILIAAFGVVRVIEYGFLWRERPTTSGARRFSPSVSLKSPAASDT
jgi:4-amino-4-deoxy-L-arabinose transferase-like glycosyltransferase